MGAERKWYENEGDYRDESGILHCGVCGDPKEFETGFGEDGWPIPSLLHTACKCERERLEQEDKERIDEEKRRKASFMRDDGIRDEILRSATFETAKDNRNIQICKRYVDKWEDMLKNNIGLIMFGSTGVGKTFASACIANALIDRCVPSYITSFTEILNSKENKSDTAKTLKKYDLVIIDDLGIERSSTYALEVIQYVIDERYKLNKPLIVTTNLSKQDVYDYKSVEYARIYDRIKEMCIPMVFTGSSMRADRAKKKAEIAKELFGK